MTQQNNNQIVEPTNEQALETITNAVRMLQLNYNDHVVLDRCINVLRKTIDSITPKIDTEGLDKLNNLIAKRKEDKIKNE